MEERRFDNLTRVLGGATSRRQLLKGMVGVALGAVFASAGGRLPRLALAANPTCNGESYDPSSQCCEPAGVQPRHPIADLASCPDRVPHPGHVPSFNGCGPAQGWIRHVIPNKIGPYRNVDFTPACNNHDICYDTCNTEKSTCDQNFLADLHAACATAYPGNGYFDRYMRAGCEADAYIYYVAVSQTQGGIVAYESAQKEACDCCPTCEECGGPDDERCCQGVCHDPCPEGQQRDPDTCSCDPCFGQEDGTVCGTNEVCCQEQCLSNQCPSPKQFSLDTCNCQCPPANCPTGQRQDPDTCQCVDLCANVTCGECETCDPTSGDCLPSADQTPCGNGQVCCGGTCQNSCGCTPSQCQGGGEICCTGAGGYTYCCYSTQVCCDSANGCCWT